MVTPVNVDHLDSLLRETRYNDRKRTKLINNFRHGFELGFQGNRKVKRFAPNLKLTVGNETILWNKVMKEVGAKRFAGPFKEPPFEHFIQSPIGLVPKDDRKETRLIFHLSYPRHGGESINSATPRQLSSVKYPEFDKAIKICMDEIRQAELSEVVHKDESKEGNTVIIIFIGKSDMRSAFRNLGM